jgi:hypothetical protein
MSRFLSLILLLMLQQSFAQNLNWVKTFGDSSADGINCLKTWGDSAVIAGTFREEIILHGNSINANGGSDIFLYWLDEYGNVYQELFIGNTNNDEVDQIAVDQDKNLYVAARFRGSLNIANQTISSNNSNYFIAKFDSTAQLLWITTSDALGVIRIEDMQLDIEEENLYLTGYYNDSLNWQNQSIYSNITANSFIIKINQNGALSWMKDLLATEEIKGRGIVAMPNNKLWFLAEFRDTIVVLNDTFFFNEVHTDILLAQLDTNGQWISAKRWGGVLYDRPRLLRRSADAEQLWMAGEFVGLLDADNLRLATAYRYYDLFWIKIDSNGNALQAGQSMTNANSYVLDLITNDQQVCLVGYFQDSLSGKSGMHYSNGNSDAFWYKINPLDASLQSSYSFGASGNDQIRAVEYGNNSLLIAGDFQNNMSLAGTNITADGSYDGFVAKFEQILSNTAPPFLPNFIKVKIIPNPSQDSFEINIENTEGLNWQLYNLQGQLLLSGTQTTISWSDLPKGSYSLHIKTEKGIAVEKVIHQ